MISKSFVEVYYENNLNIDDVCYYYFTKIFPISHMNEFDNPTFSEY